MHTIFQDVRLAFRTLLKNPGFALVAIVTLALGIGLNASMFSIVNVILFRPLPFERQDRIMHVYGTFEESQRLSVTPDYWKAMQEQNEIFETMGVYAWWSATVTEPGKPAESLTSMRVSEGFIESLKVQPMLGRIFTEEESRQGTDVTILAHGTWRRMFGSDPDIVGRTVRINSLPTTIIGVLPESFDSPFLFGGVGLYRPLGLSADEFANKDNKWLRVIGRLKDGVSIEQANASLQAIAARLEQADPAHNKKLGLRTLTLQASANDTTSQILVWMIFGLSAFVLLIACANLANLQLVRAINRSKEFAIRAALGASRFRLMRPLLTECFVLALIGGLAGLLVAYWSNQWIGKQIRIGDDATLPLPIDLRVMVVALGASLLTGLAFGVVPAWVAAGVKVNDQLKQGTRGSSPSRVHSFFRQGLVVGEFGMALVLLAGAGFFFGGIKGMLQRDTGWETERVLHGYMDLPKGTYTEVPQMFDFFERVRKNAEAVPGVEHAAIAWSLPVWGFSSSRQVTIEGRITNPDDALPMSSMNGVSPGYFDTLGQPLLEGRDFTDNDALGKPLVVIVNQSFAKAFWPNESPIGKHIGGPDPKDPLWMEIVGVARDIEFRTNLTTPESSFQLYRPFAQETWSYAALIARSSTNNPMTLVEPLRKVVADLDSDIAFQDPTTVQRVIEEGLSNLTFIIDLLAGLALLGLFLASLGIYSVISQVVAQRTSEIGIRMALGAQMRDVLWLILSSGIKLSLIGAAVGLVGAVLLAFGLQAAMPAMPTPTVAVTIVVTIGLLIVSMIACYIPARRANKVDPMVALRTE